MTSDQDPNNPDDYLRKLQQDAANAEPGAAEGGTTPSQPSYGQEPYGQQPYGQQPYAQPSAYQPPTAFPGYPNTAPAHSSATTALVLGIVGLASIPIACGIGLIVSPVAWRMGARAVQEIDASQGRLSGRESANAGRITGLIGTILLVIAVLAAVAGLALVFGASSSYESSTDTYYGNV